MTKIFYRPDPPADTSGDRRVQRTSQVQNDEAHARLFERALARAGAERQSEIRTIDKALDKQHLIDRSNEVQSTVKKAAIPDSILADSNTNAELLADQSHAVDDGSTLDQNTTDDDTGDTLNVTAGLFFPDVGFTDIQKGASEMFQSDHVCVDDSQIDELENRPRDHAGLSAMANLNQSQPDAVPGHLNDLSSLYDLVRSGDWLSAHKEWSFIFEDDGPVSELKLARNNDGLWQVAVTVPAINTSDDSSVLNALQRRLEDVGLPVDSVSIIDKGELT